MDRVRRISEEILQRYPNTFGTDFQANKDILNKVAVVHSKMLRNKIAGYITKIINGSADDSEQEIPVASPAPAASAAAATEGEASRPTEKREAAKGHEAATATEEFEAVGQHRAE